MGPYLANAAKVAELASKPMELIAVVGGNVRLTASVKFQMVSGYSAPAVTGGTTVNGTTYVEWGSMLTAQATAEFGVNVSTVSCQLKMKLVRKIETFSTSVMAFHEVSMSVVTCMLSQAVSQDEFAIKDPQPCTNTLSFNATANDEMVYNLLTQAATRSAFGLLIRPAVFKQLGAKLSSKCMIFLAAVILSANLAFRQLLLYTRVSQA